MPEFALKTWSARRGPAGRTEPPAATARPKPGLGRPAFAHAPAASNRSRAPPMVPQCRWNRPTSQILGRLDVTAPRYQWIRQGSAGRRPNGGLTFWLVIAGRLGCRQSAPGAHLDLGLTAPNTNFCKHCPYVSIADTAPRESTTIPKFSRTALASGTSRGAHVPRSPSRRSVALHADLCLVAEPSRTLVLEDRA